MTLPVLADVAKFDRDIIGGLVDESSKAVPELNILGWRTVPGDWYNSLKVTADEPTSGFFRAVNTGVNASKSTYDNTKQQCYLMNVLWQCDKGVAKASLWGEQSYIAIEAKRRMTAAFLGLGKQFYFGTSNDALGFPGLQSLVDADMEVDAQGTTPSTGSSVYIIDNKNLDNLCWVLGGDGTLEFSDIREQSIDDGTGAYYTAYIGEVQAYVGLALGHKNAIARIKNLTADNGKGLTDDLLYETLEKFPASQGITPGAILMTRRSLGQLRKSRTATNQTGAPAPLPNEVAGIPIYVTEALVNTETIESSSGS